MLKIVPMRKVAFAEVNLPVDSNDRKIQPENILSYPH